MLAVQRNQITRVHQIEQVPQLFAAGVAAAMDVWVDRLIDDARSAPKQIVD